MDSILNKMSTTSFHIAFHSLFIIHPTIERHVVKATDSFLNKPWTSTIKLYG
jgi:hypothetical protein